MFRIKNNFSDAGFFYFLSPVKNLTHPSVRLSGSTLPVPQQKQLTLPANKKKLKQGQRYRYTISTA